MKKNTMNTIALVLGILCLSLAVLMFVFVDGLQRWYSGTFFVIMGMVMLVNALRWRHEASE